MVHNPTAEMAKQCKTMQTTAKNQTLLRELNQKQPAMDFNHQTLTNSHTDSENKPGKFGNNHENSTRNSFRCNPK
jgi:hypothetical protein